ncbi:LysR substrate-binding domain-containing protein [Providencia hangzhouensis]|uniref:LysR substrate-binding domain-containing protein n=1 Tax=Providencia TaxID=586 RepID=UPI000197BCE7|nr:MULTISPECIES: LysR substrate-binding domain-containing protein [Providencia]MRF65056.1 LysR family transcriptional regulator [Escherichia coli]EFE53305.1 LysR substrate binding domain protein [Providencia rettgeri DSM 1131]MBW3104754.1 LysR family transcriptional regulator [Providencia rettgeri]MCG9528885.1 LysR substrate-binding domain-containing protein [Providencia rettgeri]PCQ39813.1 transcriptional regulator CysB [Providencia rettgeri]
MNISQLKSFVEVVRSDFNITNAAEKLYTSQPTVSKQLKILEDELNVSLFNRKNNNLLSLSPIGEKVHHVACDILAQFDKIKSIVSHEDSTIKQNLHIATTHTQIRYKLPQVIERFNTRYPNISLHFHQGAPAQIAEMVNNGDVDFAIATESMHLYDDLLVMPCYQWSRSIIVPHDHPLAQCEQLKIEDLAGYPLITYVFGFTGHSKLDQVFYQHKLTPNVVLTAVDTEIIKYYVKRGAGVGIISTVAFDPEEDSEALRCIDISHLVKPSYTHVCINRHMHLKDYMYDFISHYAPHLDLNYIHQPNQWVPTEQSERDQLYRELPEL